MSKILTLCIVFALAISINAYGLGCAPSNNNQDCENPQTQVCTKILIGTTAKVKALGKYYYQCLPNEWASQAGIHFFAYANHLVAAAQAHVLDVKPLETKTNEHILEAKPEAK